MIITIYYKIKATTIIPINLPISNSSQLLPEEVSLSDSEAVVVVASPDPVVELIVPDVDGLFKAATGLIGCIG